MISRLFKIKSGLRAFFAHGIMCNMLVGILGNGTEEDKYAEINGHSKGFVKQRQLFTFLIGCCYGGLLSSTLTFYRATKMATIPIGVLAGSATGILVAQYPQTRITYYLVNVDEKDRVKSKKSNIS